MLIGFPRVISSIHSSAYLSWNWYLDRHLCCCSVAQLYLFVTLWTVAHQAPLSMGFSRQEYWSGLPFPSPGDLPDPGIESVSPALAENSLPLSHQGSQTFVLPLGNRDLGILSVKKRDGGEVLGVLCSEGEDAVFDPQSYLLGVLQVD